jgi:hypothetical protein
MSSVESSRRALIFVSQIFVAPQKREVGLQHLDPLAR